MYSWQVPGTPGGLMLNGGMQAAARDSANFNLNQNIRAQTAPMEAEGEQARMMAELQAQLAAEQSEREAAANAPKFQFLRDLLWRSQGNQGSYGGGSGGSGFPNGYFAESKPGGDKPQGVPNGWRGAGAFGLGQSVKPLLKTFANRDDVNF